MIKEAGVVDYLDRELPELAPALRPFGAKPLSVYGAVSRFLDYTRTKVHEHNYAVARKCMRMASALYNHGDRAVRCAVENVFVFSLDSVLAADGRERKVVMPMVPPALRKLYIKQVPHMGC